VKIWIHFIWATKYRQNLIDEELKYKLYNHIRANAKEKGIYIDHINGTENHIHILVSLKGEQSVSKVAFLIKGESSHWVNTNRLINEKFEWQNEFMALSISESLVPRLRNYIRNQEAHHNKKSS
jgi:REP element-mobilizing transposase RayT